MQLIITSFIAGILTVLSPCVLPLLPVIIGGSLTSKSKSRPILITLSLAISIIIFTLLLKVSSLLINVSPEFWRIVSGGIVVLLGLVSLFPNIWANITVKLNLSRSSQVFLNNSSKIKGWTGSVLIGASLGPVFASCSPTYAIILATVLPVSFFRGLIDLIAYALGLSLLMFLIAFFGQTLIKRLKFAANSEGIFRRGLGVVFIIIGLTIMTGLSTSIQTFLANNGYLDATQLEHNFLNNDNTSNQMFNVITPYSAPEFIGDSWINSNALKISDLKGKVVLVDFWTYSCINCIRTLPYTTKWYEKYKDSRFVVIGMHAPEFQFEKIKSNVEKAAKDYNINYPILQDNDFKNWGAYKNQYWPEEYLIDKDGNIRDIHTGEGDYDKTEQLIQQLLREKGSTIYVDKTNPTIVPISLDQTPETYLGFSRAQNFNDASIIDYNKSKSYNLLALLNQDQWSLGGNWIVNEQEIISDSDSSKLNLKFSAKEVYLVMGSDTDTNVKVKLNGNLLSTLNKGADVDDNSNLKVKDYKLYKLISLPTFQLNQVIELTFQKGAKVNVFTFGS